METEVVRKFWFLQNIDEYFLGLGINKTITDVTTFVIACVCLALVLYILNRFGGKLLRGAMKLWIARTRTQWDDVLFKHRFFVRIFNVITANIILAFANIIFEGFGSKILNVTETVIKIYITVIVTQVVISFLDAANDMYDLRPAARHKSIKSYLQAIKIILYIIAGIFILSILMGKEPTSLLVGLGASAAIFSLVFKDTILGFVASIQISTQDMIRPGDWIEVPAKNADGIVEDINLTSVKVRNWNNTVTSVPIYTLVSDSFTNWRNMEDSDGRRFKRPILIDINSVERISPERITDIMSSPDVAKYSKKIMERIARGNTSDFTTNLGLFRCYLEVYLREHPKVTRKETSVARYTAPDENGIAIELYGFSNEKNLVEFERVVADIFENAIIMTSFFGLRLYQRSSDKPMEK